MKKYTLLRQVVDLLETFETDQMDSSKFPIDINGFKHWICDSLRQEAAVFEPDWEEKQEGRSPESVINTLIVHMNRYAKTYSKSAIHGSDFSTQEDFIYLINLKAFGAMSKMDLIKKNIQEKSAGIQIINRLIRQGWVSQEDSETDKRSKVIAITAAGEEALAAQMEKIRLATRIVTGDLTYAEKMELIRLLDKLDRFHKPIFLKNLDQADLLDKAGKQLMTE